jgi:hypothetical protein
MKTYGGSGGVTAPFFNSALDGGVISFMHLVTLPPPGGNHPWYPFDRQLGEPQSWFGRHGEEKNLRGIQTPAVQPIACPYTN